MSLRTLFRRRVRGVRLVELWAFVIVMALGLGVYLTKTDAGDDGAEIVRLQKQIDQEKQTTRLLRAEVAYLEQPDRLARLSAGLGLEPLKGDRDIEADAIVPAARGEVKP